MVASAVFISDESGKILMYRNYRGHIPISVSEDFRKFLLNVDDTAANPLFEKDGVTFCFVRHNDLYLYGVTDSNSNIMLIFNFLYKIIQIAIDYFGELEQESIRDNFVIMYELLDEMCDFGYPQHTDSKVLQDYICIQEKYRIENKQKPTDITSLVTGQANFRKAGIKYRKNEVFLDVIEKLTLLIAPTGNVIHSEINGSLNMKTFLTGMPELKLGLNEKLCMERKKRKRKIKSVEMDDIRFHDCVSLARFETDRTISFIPPDGEFVLMSYRLNTNVKPVMLVECHRDIVNHSRANFTIKARSEFKRRSTANNVEILIPVPPDAASPHFKASMGTVEYAPDEGGMKWTIKQLGGQRECLMRAEFSLPSIQSSDVGLEGNAWRRQPITVNFEIPYFTVSGVQVRYLKIVEKSGYKALPWVRYITTSGDYQIRID